MSVEHQFVICVKNDDYPASLELWKVYRVMPDEKAAQDQLIRVIDESGEDYLYDEDYFAPIKLPKAVEEAFLKSILNSSYRLKI
jgi:hypothetical protein